jgi:S1-C subfamily serine protease
MRKFICGLALVLTSFIPSFLPLKPVSGSALRDLEREIKAVMGKAMPAVVSIYGRAEGEGERGPGRRSVGSGFFIDRDGYLVTAAVVVRGVDRIVVIDSEGRRREGKVIGVDEPTQVALIKVDGDVPGYIELGSSGDVEPGTVVLVLGNIFVVPGNVMMGIVSNIYKEERGGIPGIEGGALQITIPVYPGMSGAPVLDVDGKAIGMAFGRFEVPSYRRDFDLIYRVFMERDKEIKEVLDRYRKFMDQYRKAIEKRAKMEPRLMKELMEALPPLPEVEVVGPSAPPPSIPKDFMEREWGIPKRLVSEEGIGFAIPADVIKKVVEDLKTKGRVVRGYLGVEPALVDERTAEKNKIPPWRGALVRTVIEGGPADKAGIKPGDVIIKYGDVEVLNPDHLRRLVRMTLPGDEIPLVVVRDGDKMEIRVKVGEVPPPKPSERPREPGPFIAPPPPPMLGLVVRDAEIEGRGAYVVRVIPGSPADKAGIKAGDVIVEVDGKDVKNASALQEMARSLKPGQKAVLTILRGKERLRVPIEIREGRREGIEL